MNETLPVHPSQRHPLTGAPIRALGVLPSGKVVWPIMGGDDTVVPVAADAPADAPVGDAPADAPAGPTGEPEDHLTALPTKVTFDEAQQAHVNALIAKKLGEKERKLTEAFEARMAEAAALAGKTDLEAATLRAEKAETDLASLRNASATTVANMRAEFVAKAAGVSDEVLADVLSLAGAGIQAAIADGEVDQDAVTEAVNAVLNRIPALKGAPAAQATSQDPALPTAGGADFAQQTGEHIYTRAQIDKLGTKYLAEHPDVLDKILEQEARGLIK